MQILFGGTFDPIHIGHIKLGLYISKLFNQQISLMPTNGIPNYKNKPIATINERIKMLEIISAKYPDNFTIDFTEANLTKYSPSICTLRKLSINGNYPRGFIIGGDSLMTLDKNWHEWEELFNYTNFIVAMRPNYDVNSMSDELANAVKNRIIYNINQFDKTKNGQIFITEFEPVDISSTFIRKNMHNKQDIIDYIDSDIYNYIVTNKIYN